MRSRNTFRPSSTATTGVAVAFLAAVAVDAALKPGAAFNDSLSNALVCAAAASCAVRAARGPNDRLAWSLIAGGLLASVAAKLVDAVVLAHHSGGPYPSAADLLRLIFYPATLAALVLLLRRGSKGWRKPTLWLDGALVALSVMALAEAFLFHGVIHADTRSTLAEATDVAYPAWDLLLLSLVAGVFAVAGWRPGRRWALIGAGLVTAGAGACVYAYQAAHGTYVHGTVLDMLWPAAALLIGVAAWAPESSLPEAAPAGWRPFALPVGFALSSLGLLVYDHFSRIDTGATVLATVAVALVIARTGVTFADSLRMLRSSRVEALTDPLTGLGNRRSLTVDLARALEQRDPACPLALVLFDLDGFKRYNDNFGHPAGDALLARLGRRLGAAVAPAATAYRLGGDEFCVVASAGPGHDALLADATAALTERGRGFVVGASHGVVVLPDETDDPDAAMRIADERLYREKASRERSAVGAQTRDVLLQVLREREPELHRHLSEVAAMAVTVGRSMGMSAEALEGLANAAELHDVGKMAIPDEILRKPGPLSAGERDYVRQHSLVGERILAAAPSLSPAARLVRASHERWDGSGYPDGLSGDEIPQPARIIAACDAYQAMTSPRPYRRPLAASDALDELRRCAGTQFDPRVIMAVCDQVERALGVAVASDELPPISVERLVPPAA